MGSIKKGLIKPLNLLPNKIIRQQRQDRICIFLSCFLLLATVLIWLLPWHLNHKIKALELKLTDMKPAASKAQLLHMRAANLRQRISQEINRRELLNSRSEPNPVDILNKLEPSPPSGVDLTKITITSEELSIAGLADAPSTIAVLLDNLQILFGSSVRLSSCQYKTSPGLYQFLIGGALKLP